MKSEFEDVEPQSIKGGWEIIFQVWEPCCFKIYRFFYILWHIFSVAIYWVRKLLNTAWKRWKTTRLRHQKTNNKVIFVTAYLSVSAYFYLLPSNRCPLSFILKNAWSYTACFYLFQPTKNAVVKNIHVKT